MQSEALLIPSMRPVAHSSKYSSLWKYPFSEDDSSLSEDDSSLSLLGFSGLSLSLLLDSSDSTLPSIVEMGFFVIYLGVNAVPFTIVGKVGFASGGNVGLRVSETTKVDAKVGSIRSDCGDFVGLGVGVLVGRVPGTTGGHVFLQME